MEARSRPSHGHASVSLKRPSWLTSFDQATCQDIIWQLLVGLVSVLVLSFKFTPRSALGFGKFNPPAAWIFWLGVASAGLGVLISFQIPLWARKSSGRWGMMHGVVILSVAVLNLVFETCLARSGRCREHSILLGFGCLRVVILHCWQLVLRPSQRIH